MRTFNCLLPVVLLGLLECEPHDWPGPPPSEESPGTGLAKPTTLGRSAAVGVLRVDLPASWTVRASAEANALAAFEVSPTETHRAPAVLRAYGWGADPQGTPTACRDRWAGAFAGGPAEVGSWQVWEVAGCTVSLLEMTGACAEPGTSRPATAPTCRLLAAVVERGEDRYSFELLAPGQVVAAERQRFLGLLNSIRVPLRQGP